MSVGNPLALALADLPKIAEQIAQGDKFTCYEHASGGLWMVAIGPIGFHRGIAYDLEWQQANLIMDALRCAAGQEPSVSRAFDTDEDSDND